MVQEIVTAIGNADIELGDTLLLLLPVLRVFDHTPELPLHAGLLGFNTPIGMEGRMQGAIGEGRKCRNAQVDTDFSSGRMPGLKQVHLDLKSHKPVFALTGDGDVLEGAFKLPAMP